MPFTTLGFEMAQGTKYSSLLEYIGVVEDHWENIKTKMRALRPLELIGDLNTFITR